MARARNIKPSFFQNEELAELDPLARLFFIGLWTVADYKGRVEFRPKRLKVQILPYDDCDTEQLAKNLERSGFVQTYSVDGQRYLKVVNFEKHQNPHKNEREAGSEIPDIDIADDQAVDSIDVTKNRDKDGTARDQNGTAPADSLNLIPDPPILIPEQSSARSADLFGQFWEAYPKKVGKQAAERAFSKLKKPAETLTKILAALEWQRASFQWTRDGGQYVPNPATYLNQGRWLDEPQRSAGPRPLSMNNIGVDDATPQGFSDGRTH